MAEAEDKITFDLADFFIENDTNNEQNINYPIIEVPDNILAAIQRDLEGPEVQNEHFDRDQQIDHDDFADE